MKDRELRTAARHAINAIADATSDWYANGIIEQKKIDRLIRWEFTIRNILNPQKKGKLVTIK